MNDTLATIEALEAAHAAHIDTINPQAEVRRLGGNIFGIVEYCDYGDIQFIGTYTIEDLGLPTEITDGDVWHLTIRNAEDDGEEILFEATGDDLPVLVARGAEFMGEAAE